MAERMGANGSPIQKKVVTWEESQETLQEILEVNPNSSPVEEVEEVEVEEVEIEEDFDEDLDEEEDDE
jgi:hypothetical protein|tara:strand:+ start:20 stop:223 length:204 start_codon:yes stop_codon:yes gene_type:complete